MEMSTLLSTQALPSDATEVGLVALGQLEPERAGKGSRQGSLHVKPWMAPALNRQVTVLNMRLLSLSSAWSPERRLGFLPAQRRFGSCSASCRRSLRLGTLWEDSAVGSLVGLGVRSWVPFLALPLPGCVVLGMLFSILLNLNFLVCETGKILAPNSQDCVRV